MYVLTVNGQPLCVSKNTERLQERMRRDIERTCEIDELEVLVKGDTYVTYHTGISYETDNYEIILVEEI